MTERATFDILISGVGGQGVVLASYVLSDNGCIGMSSAVETRENAADDGLIWAEHANEEVGNWEVFVPTLTRLYRVITDPEICPYYSFRVEGSGREARYAEL